MYYVLLGVLYVLEALYVLCLTKYKLTDQLYFSSILRKEEKLGKQCSGCKTWGSSACMIDFIFFSCYYF